MDINKLISSRDNMNELLRSGISSSNGASIEYNKATIRPIPEDHNGNNTAIDVVIRYGTAKINATAFYKRPDISKVPNDNPWDDADVRPVFLYECALEYMYNQAGLEAAIHPLVSDRLNITSDSFSLLITDTSKADDGIIKMSIVSSPNDETIINSTHCYAVANIPQHTIWDTGGEYGLWAPESFISEAKNRPSFFKTSSVINADTISSGNTEESLLRSIIQSYINKTYTDTPSMTFDIEEVSQNSNGTSTSKVKIVDSTNYEFFGKYHIRQFDPALHFYNKNNDEMIWDESMQGKITSSASNRKIIYYADEVFARDEVTPSDAGLIQDLILKQIFGDYGLPVDKIEIDKNFGQRLSPSGETVTEWVFTVRDSISVRNDVYTVHILYSRNNKCQLLDFVSYTDSNNHIGVIEGINDGWSTTNVEWWQIDSGGVTDSDGNTIRQPSDWENGKDWTWTPPPGGGPNQTFGGKYYEGGNNYHNDGEDDPPGGNLGKPSEYDKASGDAEYKHTDLGSISDPNIQGFVI